MGTDRDWRKWGETDPYFGVYREERFRSTRMSDQDLEAFFASGEAHIAQVLSTVEQTLWAGFAPRTGLDFGSGVGRLVIPMAKRMEQVTGIDVSPAMIREARKNCSVSGVGNVEFVDSSEGLPDVHGQFDFVHSVVVFQHVPWRRGRGFLRSLASHVSPRGVLAVHLLGKCTAPVHERALARIRYVVPPVHWLWNIAKGRTLTEPPMQLHAYPLSTVVGDLASAGLSRVHMEVEPTADRSFLAVMLYAAHAERQDTGLFTAID